MRLVIVGAGFGGLRLARALNNKAGFEITLLDKYNYHQFQPLFYQVATAGLDASSISFPLRKVFQKSKNVRFCMAEVKEILHNENKVITDIGIFEYDKLLLATGAETNFFGNEILQANTMPMKSTVEAIQLRHRLLKNFEDASATINPSELQRLMTIVVVGGGATGVELSGAIADMRRFVLPKDYPELDFSAMKIILLEGSSKLLPSMSEKSSQQSKQYLEKLGVIVQTNTIVKNYDGKTTTLQDATTIETALVIWAAGVKGNVIKGIDDTIIAKGNRIKVNNQCLVNGFENVFAIGDIAFMDSDILFPNGHPQVAAVAIQQADLVVFNLKNINNTKQLQTFVYHDKGAMATVGRKLAVVDVPKPKIHFGGFLAWLVWMFLHLMFIVGVKNRVSVFFNWFYSYFTKDQNLRLIFKVNYRERNKI